MYDELHDDGWRDAISSRDESIGVIISRRFPLKCWRMVINWEE